jgi:hypothetical protein
LIDPACSARIVYQNRRGKGDVQTLAALAVPNVQLVKELSVRIREERKAGLDVIP